MFLLKCSAIIAFLLVVALAVGQESSILRQKQLSFKTKRDQSKVRDSWFARGRTVPGQSSAVLRLRAYQQKLQLRKVQPSVGARITLRPVDQTPQVWQPLGPSPLASDASGFGQQDYGWVSGRATAVVIDRADPNGNTVYVGGAYGGVWKSSNAGASSPNPASVIWTPLIDDQPTLAVGAIAIQPQLSNPDPSRSVVLVGTGETNSSTDSYYGMGILRSADGGATWNLISQDAVNTHSFAGVGFSKIAFSTSSPNLVVAAVAGASQGLIEGLANPPSPNLGIYYSTNSGVSWNFAAITDSGATITPSSVTSVAYNDAAGLFIAAVRSHGFYSSTDGSHWTRLINQPGLVLSAVACTPLTSQNCPIYRGELAAVRGRNEMYAWYVDANDNDEGIWKTVNAGSSWTQISTTTIDACGDAFDGCGTENGTYNLALSAIANGATATDLYAGAVNIYKCSLNSQSPTCNGPHVFLNLTHAFGCSPNFGSIAHVHPAQHAIDSLVANGSSVLYFANDGGVYRALDGYTGLNSGDCGTNNQFDSLNQTLGAMTQFVAFAQHPGDANTLLGGAQGNGAPATAQALVGSGWRNVNAGDGGFSEINPANPAEWFTSNPGVNIQRCTLGVECHAQDFAANPVVSSATLDGDAGPFYTPFILDPQNPSEMIVGTCRLWRGVSDGSGFTALSNNLDTGSDTTCNGNEANLVRAIAAGGPKDSNALSPVIYAGTDGFGPLVTATPAAGRVWISNNTDGGRSTWVDRTGSINPQHFPISSIAVDTSDANGTTAYAAVMGFHVSHLWMTRNGGVSWSDFTGNLPDTPVNAVVVDSGLDPLSGTIYVGTDVGVFASSTVGPNWSEIGPSSGQSGFLPNVPVTALRIFNGGLTKLLRASTYGRGLWQFSLTTAADFQVSVPDPIQTIFLSQTAIFNAGLSSLNNYTGSVSLSCVSGSTPPPQTCAISTSSISPGGTFTLTASGEPGDYSFQLHAAGTPPDNIVHDVPITLHIIDLGLTVPNPAVVSLNPGDISQPIGFQVTAQGSFQQSVTLSCSGLPTGATCNFLPANVVSPTAMTPTSITLTIGTTSSSIPGNFSVLIHAATPNSPDKTQNMTLVVSKHDYAITISSPTLTGIVNTATVFNGSLSTTSGYGNQVSLSCGPGAPPACTVSPATVIPSSNGTSFTVTVNSSAAQSYSFNVLAQGSDVLGIVHSTVVNFQSIFDFSLTANPNSQNVAAGQSANYPIDLSPRGGKFVTAVSLSCSNVPAKTACAFSSSLVPSGSGETQVILTIATTASTAALSTHSYLLYAMWLPCLGFVLCSSKKQHRNRNKILLMITFVMVFAHFGCGGGGLQGNNRGSAGVSQPGTTPGNYTLTVTAAAGSVTHSTTVSLIVQ